MALSSGIAGGAQPIESFSRSGFSYRVSRGGTKLFLEFEGFRKELAYFIGSGAAARSYLLDADGFLFQAPVAYYSTKAKWDLAPGYDQYAYPYVTRPVTDSCLGCHASFLNPLAGTQNGYLRPPFAEGGVACVRCHGNGEEHIAKQSPIVNPAKLPPSKRDRVCAQCHLAGEVRVAGTAADDFTVFVRAGASPAMRVTGHVEKLAQSKCKQNSGDRLWCGTCHDPHSVPKAAQKDAWFQAKCANCHGSGSCTGSSRSDCITCHMPKNEVVDAQHVVYTDHSIPRRPRKDTVAASPGAELVPFGGGTAKDRDLGVAYAMLGLRQPGGADFSRALKLLPAEERRSPNDVDVLVYLAELYRTSNRETLAEPLYRRAIRLDASQVTARVGLGAILYQRGNYTEAAAVWKEAISRSPGLDLVRTNLAMAQIRLGQNKEAESTLRRGIELSPGFRPGQDLLKKLGELRN